MKNENEFSLSEELEELGGRLAEARPELSPLELDSIKARVIAPAGRATRHGKGQFMRSRLATIMLAFALVLGGSGVVWAGAGGHLGSSGGSSSAGNSQYCPPTSHAPGKPKHQGGGNKCGQPNHGHP